MTAVRIDGKAVAAELRGEIAVKVKAFEAYAKRLPGLTVVLVGEDPASEVYVRNKGVQTREAGMVSNEIKLPGTTSQAELLSVVATLNADKSVDGILVQMPLPKQIDTQAIIEAIDPAKDVDGLHPANAGKLNQGIAALTPCTPLGCMILLEKSGVQIAGANAVVIGRSILVGRPVAALLLAANATVTIAHSRTRDLAAVCRQADIVIAAVGKPELVRGDWIKPGAAVIDVGINRVAGENGKTRLIGDVHYASAEQVAGVITPVPGGVGPMTIACLLQNTLTAACYREKIDPKSL
ncbi:bifunctional methylenetetrahydrofolate dehydrogenase/methenyltetrahydrofolate cyclohydrolase FolD [Ferrovibrio sp.]|uniref:bifunctional methylenetetrahydrofolate dehydrogenase/methenyltetrahydrofolate cyclohydrolase FolD n=1 Tax=Ferrovibrio sp. TaxID=1917215 RepID=UPI000CB7915D|nr:bifunctional methylenetetrahydrofolate dehydrogenase/methenyltetrahydrofolate cyclohydrolase FolD [Ferrovibrio sp.]PJI43904.1 MAG: bifunctional methylenetetrahydrofolate dehydrogenase/methenyltetrahydrofolate cyclohydrolase FolD [Ferrovibrio sp.]